MKCDKFRCLELLVQQADIDVNKVVFCGMQNKSAISQIMELGLLPYYQYLMKLETNEFKLDLYPVVLAFGYNLMNFLTNFGHLEFLSTLMMNSEFCKRLNVDCNDGLYYSLRSDNNKGWVKPLSDKHFQFRIYCSFEV